MENIIFQVIVVERFHVITSSLRHFLLAFKLVISH